MTWEKGPMSYANMHKESKFKHGNINVSIVRELKADENKFHFPRNRIVAESRLDARTARFSNVLFMSKL